MNNNSLSNNKRIAKNTLLLYIRMFVIMAISLFTSRVILKVLGVEDFGIYNVVGGIIAMLGVLNASMTVSTQRFLTFELGTGNKTKLKKNFSMCFTIYLILALIFVVLAETVGLWFLNTHMTIPSNRIFAANWVYQFTIISSVFSLLTNPYNASIIAHENMNVFAYVSMGDAMLKLVIVYLLLVIDFDKLIVYGALILCIQLFDMALYFIYCVKHYEETHYKFFWDKDLFKELFFYSGWNLFGSLCAIAKGQGLNILLNMFFNPSVNAARGIAFQVNNIVSQFFTNFYTAVRPQITKYYAQNDLENMFNLVFRSSKFTFYLILLMSLPLLIESPFIINLWLGQLPEYVVSFMRLIIIVTAIDATASPIMTTCHATGNIKLYQSLVGAIIILILPISYVVLTMGASPISVFIVSVIFSGVGFFARLWVVRRLVNFPVKDYLLGVCGKVVLVAIIASIVPCIVHVAFTKENTIALLNCFICIVSTVCTIYMIGLSHNEKQFIVSTIKKKLHR